MHRPGVVGEKDADKEDIDRQTRAARHERQQQGGKGLVSRVFQGAGGVDAGDVAAEAEQHRDKGFAVQADGVHRPVHDEGGPGHVAAPLQKGDEEHHGEDHRHEDQDKADPGDDAVD